MVGSAAASSLTDVGEFTPGALASAAINYTYDNPGDNGSEYVVAITAGNGYKQVRRISSNTADTLTLEHPWGVIPSVGDTYEVYEIWATPEAMNPSRRLHGQLEQQAGQGQRDHALAERPQPPRRAHPRAAEGHDTR